MSLSSEDPETLSGRLLVAMPGIGDPRFERAVILMVSHSAEEAMGIALNRPVQGLSLPSLLEKLGVRSQIVIPEQSVLIGGPAERERGFVLHTDDYRTSEATLRVGEGIGMTATREVLDAMGDPNRRPRRATLALGCAGWSSGQLEDELRGNVWLIADPDEALVFDDEHESKWARALAKIGVAPDRLSATAGRA